MKWEAECEAQWWETRKQNRDVFEWRPTGRVSVNHILVHFGTLIQIDITNQKADTLDIDPSEKVLPQEPSYFPTGPNAQISKLNDYSEFQKT